MQNTTMPHETLPAETLELLRQRAERLGGAESEDSSNLTTVKNQENVYLCFRLLDEHYGLPLKSVNEIIPLRNIVQVPRGPRHVVGLIRLRGKVLTLVDMRRFWHGAAVGYADSDLAVILREKQIELGLVCTEVEGLFDFAPGEIKDVPQNTPARLAASLRGLTRRDTMLIAPSSLFDQPGFMVRAREKGE